MMEMVIASWMLPGDDSIVNWQISAADSSISVPSAMSFFSKMSRVDGCFEIALYSLGYVNAGWSNSLCPF